MEPRSSPQQLPQGKGNEQVMKEEIEVKLAVAEDTDDGEMEHREDTRSRVEYYGQRKENLKEADGVKLDVPEDTEPQPISLLVSLTGKGKDQMKEADEEELDAPKESDETDAESSMAAQRHLTKEGGEIEENHVDARMSSESQETDSEAQTLDAPPYAESSTAAERRLAEGEGEIQEEPQEGDRTTPESLNQEQDPIFNYVEGKEEMEQADEVKLYVAEHKTLASAVLDVESPMADQRQLVSEGFFHNFRRKMVRVCLLCRTGEEKTSYKASAAMMSSDEETSSIIEGEAAAMMASTNSLSELDRINIYAPYIHKVHLGLRSHGEIAKHYEPILVSIGPYHHGKEALQDMEKKKKQYMQVLQKRVTDKSNDAYMKALENERGEPKQALHCYVDTFTMDVDSFRECMVLDGLFMIEVFQMKKKSKDYDDKDMFFTMEWMKHLLRRDLLLFENQIPLFVLRQLFKLTEEKKSERDFVELALGFFVINGKRISQKEIEIECLDNIPHLLGLVYEALSVRKRRDPEPAETDKQNRLWKLLGFINEWKEFVRRSIQALVPETCKLSNKREKLWKSIRSAAALEEVGVTFDKADDDDATIYDIEFNGGTLRIPRLVIEDNTESLFRNLVAYEQYSNKCRLHRITNYLQVMDYLINTPKDVELLRHRGIIENMLGDDVKVSTMFNQICSGVLFNKNKFFYTEMFDEVNKFCERRRNVWMKKLKNEYFGSPWTLISFMAAVMLLLLTVTQTVFAVISYCKQ